MEDCIFCKIVKKQIPSNIIYETDRIMAFEDINPMAPVHIIVVPKQHIATLMDVTSDNITIMDDIVVAIQEIAKQKGIDSSGFRTVINCNKEGGQVIFHLHVHILGGKRLKDNLA